MFAKIIRNVHILKLATAFCPNIFFTTPPYSKTDSWKSKDLSWQSNHMQFKIFQRSAHCVQDGPLLLPSMDGPVQDTSSICAWSTSATSCIWSCRASNSPDRLSVVFQGGLWVLVQPVRTIFISGQLGIVIIFDGVGWSLSMKMILKHVALSRSHVSQFQARWTNFRNMFMIV